MRTTGAVRAAGAPTVVACITHAILSGEAVDRIEASVLDEVVVTDTIPLQERARTSKKIRVRSVAPLLAEAIQRTHNEDSISSLFV